MWIDVVDWQMMCCELRRDQVTEKPLRRRQQTMMEALNGG